jgi:hypothetical protein
VTVSSVPAAAQAPTTGRYDVAGGYAFMRDQDIARDNPDISANFPAGWMASGSARVWRWLAVAGEVGGSSKTVAIPGDQPKLRVYTFLAGPRVRRPPGDRIVPFGQVLVGAARASTSVLTVTETVTDLAYQPGGGVDVMISGRLGVRAEGDWRIIRSDGTNSKEPRFTLGAVVAF